jgi:hypothetical protein
MIERRAFFRSLMGLPVAAAAPEKDKSEPKIYNHGGCPQCKCGYSMFTLPSPEVPGSLDLEFWEREKSGTIRATCINPNCDQYHAVFDIQQQRLEAKQISPPKPDEFAMDYARGVWVHKRTKEVYFQRPWL